MPSETKLKILFVVVYECFGFYQVTILIDIRFICQSTEIHVDAYEANANIQMG